MFKKLKELRSSRSAFTIIEVMIVMAIAGLIIVAVLVAVPQLQKNQRNSARQNVLSRIKAEIDNFAGNNNGAIPVASVAGGTSNFGTPMTASGFFIRYLGCTASASPATCSVNINDPKTGFPVGTGAAGTTVTGISVGADPTSPGDISYQTGKVCSGETTAAGSARQYALQIGLEGGAVYCIDNK